MLGIVNRKRTQGLRLFRRIAEVLPRRCRVCEAVQRGKVNICPQCVECFGQLPPICSVCAEPLSAEGASCLGCAEQLPAFKSATALWEWRSPLDNLIKQFKFQGDRALGLDLAELFAQGVAPRLRQSGELPDMLLPMPLHKTRLAERGFNQSAILADALSRELDVEVVEAVRRIRATPAQASLKRKERLSNLKGAFAAEANVVGLSIAIVDDVMTTGSSVQVLSQTLLDAGAASVQVLVLAKVL